MGTITARDGTEIFYKDRGTGKPVVFSHGWPLTADAWDDQWFLVASRATARSPTTAAAAAALAAPDTRLVLPSGSSRPRVNPTPRHLTGKVVATGSSPLILAVSRDQGGWQPDSHWIGTGGHHDPIANPGDLREMDGQAMTTSGGSHNDTPALGHPAAIQIGRAAPAVTQIVLTHEDRRPLDTRFGFWVICTEQPSPFQVTGLDKDGTVLAQIND